MRFRFSFCVLFLCVWLAPARATRDLAATFEIRKKCAQLDAQSRKLTRQTEVVLEMAHEGSEITALKIRGQIRKLFVTHLGTMGRIQETIYLESGRPIWVTQIKTTYDAPLSGRIVERMEEWIYFQNGQLIQRDWMPVTFNKGVTRIRRNWIHQTSITSPKQAREWKNKAIEWRERIAQYERALKAKS